MTEFEDDHKVLYGQDGRKYFDTEVMRSALVDTYEFFIERSAFEHFDPLEIGVNRAVYAVQILNDIKVIRREIPAEVRKLLPAHFRLSDADLGKLEKIAEKVKKKKDAQETN